MMIFPRHYGISFCFDECVVVLKAVINKNLVGALPHLSFVVKLEAATKCVNLILEAARCVSASSLELIVTVISDIVPGRL